MKYRESGFTSKNAGRVLVSANLISNPRLSDVPLAVSFRRGRTSTIGVLPKRTNEKTRARVAHDLIANWTYK
jgi:hypothetical protein